MCGAYQPTNVISISYSSQEDDFPAYYLRRQCQEFLKLGLQGLSVFVASGDVGVAGNGYDIHGSGKENCLLNGTVFNPTAPSKFIVAKLHSTLWLTTQLALALMLRALVAPGLSLASSNKRVR